MSQTYLTRIGGLIRDARRHKGMTQSDLAELLGSSQGAVTRIEQGKQNLSLEMLAKIGDALDSEFVSLGHSGPQHLRIVGGQKLTGSIDVKTSKNAAVALLCASLLNRGRTTLRNLDPTFGQTDGAQLLDVYVHVPGAASTSTSAAFASRNYQIAPDGAWSQRSGRAPRARPGAA